MLIRSYLRNLFVQTLVSSSLCLSFLSASASAAPQGQNRQNPNRDAGPRANKGDLAQRIDQLVQEKVRELNVPGYSLVVIHNGKTVLQKGYGFADKEAGIPVTPKTVFGLASITKTFTAFALLLLVDDGKVSLDDTLDKYFNDLSPAYKHVTIQQLATMSAGVPVKAIGDHEGMDWQQEFRNVQGRPLDFKPGTQFEYSNLSFRILGGVIEKASGKSYMEFLKERVLDPLGMAQTLPTDQTFALPIAVPYGPKGKPLDGYKPTTCNFAAGMLASNTIDMAKYAEALLDQKFLSPAGYRNLWKQRQGLKDEQKGKTSPWAFGWASTNRNGHFQVAMNGGLPGIASSILIFPDDRLIVVGLANVDGDPHKIAPLVAKEVLGIDVGEAE